MSRSDTKAGHAREKGLQTLAASPPAVEGVTDCWNTIGVGGDGSCPELPRHVHCRNCPVYAHAGLRILDRPLPEAYRHEWTEHFTEKRKPAAGSRLSAVIFRLGTEWLALPTQTFQEVTEQRPIHSIPHRGHGMVLGLVNVRGELLVCVSVARLLGLSPDASSEKLRSCYTRLLVFVWEGNRLAFPVDEIQGIYRLRPEEITGPARKTPAVANTFTQGVFSWQHKVIGLLDPELLFSTLNRSLA